MAAVWQDGALYGNSVDLDGDRMAVGQIYGPYDAATGTIPGSAYLYRRGVSGWVPDGVVQASDGDDLAWFGYSVALDGDRLLVGAPLDGYLAAKGAVYVYERQGDGVWIETAKLVPDEIQAFTAGYSVDLEGDRAIVGARGITIGLGWGRVYVYECVAGVWVMQQEILPSFSESGDCFGEDLDLQGDRLAVGASYTTADDTTGRAFVFERQAGVWKETAVLLPGDLGEYDRYGTGIALDGDSILVGAPGHHVGTYCGFGGVGATYAFELQSGAWTMTQKLLGTGTCLSFFGTAIDLAGDRAVIGTPEDSVYGTYAGSASTFERTGGTWQQVAKFGGSEPFYADTFGFAIDMEGDELLIGAPSVVTGGSGVGAVYLFSFDAGPHLTGNAASVSVAQGGAQTLALGACAAHAGDLFLVAGSATGTSPGFAFAGLPVPLNPDAYFLHTLNHVGAPPLSGAFGTFDAWGRGEASFALPAGSAPGLTGLVLHHAYAVLDGATLALEAVSPAVPVALTP